MLRCVTVRSYLAAALVVTAASHLSATTILLDDFESYANQAAFASSWTAIGSPPHMLDTAFGRNSAQSIRLGPQIGGSGVSNRYYKDLGTPVLPTDTNPIVFSFDFYLDPAGASTNWSSDWQLADVRAYSGGTFGSGSIDGVVALGVVRPGGQHLDTYNPLYFQGRLLNPSQSGATYYSLDSLPNAVQRSSGWHNLAARIGATSTLFLVDNVPAELVTQGITTPFSTLILGSDLSSSAFWLDNIQLEQVPEPCSSGLAVAASIGLLMSIGRRRR